VGIKEFLQQYVQTSPGVIIDTDGQEIGQHEGAIFYTIGQRHGLNVGGGLPYYVIGKDMAKNQVFVTRNLDHTNLWRDQLKLTDMHWINGQPDLTKKYQVRTRYRAKLVECNLESSKQGMIVRLKDQVRAVTPGQSAVIYDDQTVLGGGIVV
jgi:tRNA-specific 2-thiouridylase